MQLTTESAVSFWTSTAKQRGFHLLRLSGCRAGSVVPVCMVPLQWFPSIEHQSRFTTRDTAQIGHESRLNNDFPASHVELWETKMRTVYMSPNWVTIYPQVGTWELGFSQGLDPAMQLFKNPFLVVKKIGPRTRSLSRKPWKWPGALSPRSPACDQWRRWKPWCRSLPLGWRQRGG